MLIVNCTLKRLSGREEKGLAHTAHLVVRSLRSPRTGFLAGEGAPFRTVGREEKGLVQLVVRSPRSPRPGPREGDCGDAAGGGCRTTPCRHQRRRPARLRPARDRGRGASSGNDALPYPTMAAPPGFGSRDRGEEGQSWRVGSRGFE